MDPHVCDLVGLAKNQFFFLGTSGSYRLGPEWDMRLWVSRVRVIWQSQISHAPFPQAHIPVRQDNFDKSHQRPGLGARYGKTPMSLPLTVPASV